MIDKFVNNAIDARLKDLPKPLVGTVKAVGAGTVTINLPDDPTDVEVQNNNEIPAEIGDQVSITVYGNQLGNAVVDFRKGITLNNIYVDYINGHDFYGYNSSGIQYGTINAPFKTLQYTINRLPKLLSNDRNILIYYINLNPLENLIISGFVGQGSIVIQPYSGTSVGYINSMWIYSCIGTKIVLNYIGCNGYLTEGGGGKFSFYIFRSTVVSLNNCETTFSNSSVYGIGVSSNSFLTVTNCTVSNHYVGLIALFGSTVYSSNNTGLGNIYGIGALYSSYFGKDGTQVNGSTTEWSDSSSTIK